LFETLLGRCMYNRARIAKAVQPRQCTAGPSTAW
jgi:hypothetical protein